MRHPPCLVPASAARDAKTAQQRGDHVGVASTLLRAAHAFDASTATSCRDMSRLLEAALHALSRDPAACLAVDPGASAADVRRAYLRLARTHHPDKTGGATAVLMAAITAARNELLSTTTARDDSVEVGGRAADTASSARRGPPTAATVAATTTTTRRSHRNGGTADDSEDDDDDDREDDHRAARDADAAWERAFWAMAQFEITKGHCYAPRGTPLGEWGAAQRIAREQGRLRRTRRARLEAIGFNVDDVDWRDHVAGGASFVDAARTTTSSSRRVGYGARTGTPPQKIATERVAKKKTSSEPLLAGFAKSANEKNPRETFVKERASSSFEATRRRRPRETTTPPEGFSSDDLPASRRRGDASPSTASTASTAAVPPSSSSPASAIKKPSSSSSSSSWAASAVEYSTAWFGCAAATSSTVFTSWSDAAPDDHPDDHDVKKGSPPRRSKSASEAVDDTDELRATTSSSSWEFALFGYTLARIDTVETTRRAPPPPGHAGGASSSSSGRRRRPPDGRRGPRRARSSRL